MEIASIIIEHNAIQNNMQTVQHNEYNAVAEYIVLIRTRICSVCVQTQEHQAACFCPAGQVSWVFFFTPAQNRVFLPYSQSDSVSPLLSYICWLRHLETYSSFIHVFLLQSLYKEMLMWLRKPERCQVSSDLQKGFVILFEVSVRPAEQHQCHTTWTPAC